MSRPPRLAERLLEVGLAQEIREHVLGDLEEEYGRFRSERGRLRAAAWYWRQALGSIVAAWLPVFRGASGDPRGTRVSRRAEGSRDEGRCPSRIAAPQGPRRRFETASRSSVTAFVDSLRQDVRLALRSFARSPGLVVAAVVTLALGIGATTTVFGLAHWLLLRPVPGVHEPEDVALLWFGRHTETTRGESFRPAWVSYPNLRDIESRLTHLSGLAGYQDGSVNAAADEAGNAGGTAARRIPVQWVSHSFFDLLGVRMALGRPFTATEDDPVGGGTPVAVIGHGLWTSMFGGDREVLGRTLWVNGLPYSVVGVAAAEFQGAERGGDVEAWLPRSTTPRARRLATFDFSRRGQGGGFYEFVARLAPDSTWEQADAELAAIATWLEEEYPEANEKFRENRFVRFGQIGAPAMGRDRIASTLWLLGAVVVLVLLIACTNVANLLLMEGLGRRSELAVRKALGATRGRLLQQQLVEGLFLWLAGGAAGAVLAVAAAPLLEGRQVAFLPLAEVSFGGSVFAFTAGISLLVGMLFSSLPAVAASSTHAEAALKEGGSSATARRRWLRGGFVVAQLAASLTLVVGALLLVQTLHNLTRVELGFDPKGVLFSFSNPGDHGYDTARTGAYFQELQRRLEARPEILEATVAGSLPLGGGRITRVRRAGQDDDTEPLEPYVRQVRPGYFELLRTPIVRGRAFTDADFRPSGEPAADIVVVSEELARRLFGTLDVLGEGVEFPVRGRHGRTYRIVGVASDVQFTRLSEAPPLLIYEPLQFDDHPGVAAIFFRPAPGAAELVPAVREVAASLDPTLPAGELQSLEDVVDRQLGDWNTLADLIGLLALIAVVLSAVGLHGVVGFDVVARAKEFGIRMTLGAESRKIFLLVLRDTAMLGLLGVVLGLGGAAAFARVLESRLFEITPFDPLTWMAAAFGLLVVAFSAAAVPAYRATRVDPIETLRVQ